MKKKFLLTAIFLSFFALGMPDGAFSVAWYSIRHELRLGLETASVLVIVHSVFYATVSSQIGHLAKLLKLPNVNMLGLVLLVAGMGAFAAAPNFAATVFASAVLGTGMGMVDAGLNAYVSQNFSARSMNWLHCFWGMGGAISPLIMTQAILLAGWRMGYVTILTLQAALAFFVFVSLFKGLWEVCNTCAGNASALFASQKATPSARPPFLAVPEETSSQLSHSREAGSRFLSNKIYPVLQMAALLIYTGAEYSVILWTTGVMLASRGMHIDRAGLFPAVFLACLTGGRFLSGVVSSRLSNTILLRLGLGTAIVGIFILTFSDSLSGAALAGLGFAPVYPCLIHENKRRFSPKALTKLVGYQVAAAGIGVAATTFGMGRVLAFISLEALFPLVICGIAVVFALNETIERGMTY